MSESDSGREPVKVVIINKSDSTGGAAVVSRRLMEALRAGGADARMLVVEKLTDSPYVEEAASRAEIKWKFLAERLKIFACNGFNRKTLFRIDTASDGLPLWRHPLVEGADAVFLNWVNQGMLSLKGIRRILSLGKPVVWTMHDMWCMTGICHHAGECTGFLGKCGECPLLGKMGGDGDLSRRIWSRKMALNSLPQKITYVAVSNWLAGKAAESTLLSGGRTVVIPNAFHIDGSRRGEKHGTGIRILFGAARLDDPIKGLPVLVEMTRTLRRSYPGLASRMELLTFGGVKDPGALEGMDISHRHLGMIKGDDRLRELYESADIVVSASGYETLPGTLVEAQAYGCVPVSFNRGGQSDIISHCSTGYIAVHSDDEEEAAGRLAAGVAWAADVVSDPRMRREIIERMRRNVEDRFSPHAVAEAYMNLLMC